MGYIKKITAGCISFLFCIHPAFSQVETDTVFYPRDSVIELPPDPTTIFFQEGEKIKTPDKVRLRLKNKKQQTLAAFFKELGYGDPDSPQFMDHVLSDLDNDGKKELLIWNYTGGAHCCDEIWLFRPLGNSLYQYTHKLFAGNIQITAGKEFVYNFHEQMGYFFTCFACGYEDSTGRLVPLAAVSLRYQQGKLLVQPGDTALKKIINANLSLLGSRPFQALDEEWSQDDGWRKEIALNLAVFYYSFGRNLSATCQLFLKHYRHPDAVRFWDRFREQIRYIRTQNDF